MIRVVATVAVLSAAVGLSAQPPRALVLSQLSWFSRSGMPLEKVGPVADHGNFELSPDGTKVAVAVVDQKAGTRDVWIYDTKGGARTRFTTDAAEENWMILVSGWPARGAQLLCSRPIASPGIAGRRGVVDRNAPNRRGRRVARELVARRQVHLVCDQQPRDQQRHLGAASVGGGKPYPFQQTPASENWAAFSPDGRWVAYSSTASSDVPEVFVTRFPDKGPSWRISADGGLQARWRRDASEIFYLAPDRRLMAAAVTERNGTMSVTKVDPLFTMTFPYGAYHAFDVSADGSRFLVNTVLGAGAPTQQVRGSRAPRPRG